MLKKVVLSLSIVFISFSQVFAKAKSEYLELSNTNKEFQITSLMNSAIANDVKATEIFIASGANVNQKNIAGVSPLLLASRNNSYEVAEVLLKSGANVNEKDNEGWTPLMRASLSGNKKMMELLIKNGANIWGTNSYGETALLHTAMADCYECGKLILENTHNKNYLINTQIGKSLQIVNKRYNEPFINMLKEEMNVKKSLTSNNSKKTGNQEQKSDSTYIFTGEIANNKDKVVEKPIQTKQVKEQKPLQNNKPKEIKEKKALNNKKYSLSSPKNEIVEEKPKTIPIIAKEEVEDVVDTKEEAIAPIAATDVKKSEKTSKQKQNIDTQDENENLRNFKFKIQKKPEDTENEEGKTDVENVKYKIKEKTVDNAAKKAANKSTTNNVVIEDSHEATKSKGWF